MVINKIFVYIYMFLLPLSLQADFANSDIFVTSSIDEYRAYANQPLNGTFTVTHDQSQSVDTSSFLIDNKPIKVEFVQDVKISSNSPLVISYYHFQMPAQPAGLYVLPEGAVKIAGKQYRSIMSSYEVKGGIDNFTNMGSVPSASPPTQIPTPTSTSSSSSSTSSSNSSTSSAANALPSKIILKLEADSGSNKSLYPGQKTKFSYRYFYNTNISLTKEQLPLLEAEGFLKFGDKESKDYTENNMSVREISQIVEAVKSGTFSFGPSVIEGYAYTQNNKGQPSYSSSKLVSEVPAMAVTVLPFPEKGKPPSFNGAIGDFDFMTTLASPANMHVGDEINLNVDITGKGDIVGLSLPDVSRQPGFPGFFRMSDLPPVGSVNADTKHFVLSMRPLVEVKEIPGIAFSFFNPATGDYTTLTSKPIPINVKSVEDASSKASEALENPAVPKPAGNGAPKTYLPKPIEIQGNYSLQTADLYNKIFGTWQVMGMVPFVLALLFYQITLRDYLIRKKNEIKQETSQDVYSDFLQEKKGTSRYYELLDKSLKLKLVESGHISNPDFATEDLPTSGESGEVRAFLNEIEEKRFSKSGELNLAALESRAQVLIKYLDKTTVTPGISRSDPSPSSEDLNG